MTNLTAPDSALDSPPMGTFDASGEYIPREVVLDDLGTLSLDEAYSATMVDVADGQIVEGTVVRVDRDEVLLDIGYKSEGVIPPRELSIRNGVHPGEIVAIGERIEAMVVHREDNEGRLVLSKKRAQYERAWGRIEDIKEGDGMVDGTVIEVVKGGLIVDIGLRGFLPASLVELRRVRDLQPYMDTTIQAKIIELDKNRNNVVLSRRAWLEETQKEQREDFLDNLRPGEVRSGVVSSVVNFGAFVDLGGMDGLMGLLPGVAKVKSQLAQAKVDDGMLRRQEAIIQSMTPGERRKAKVLNSSRKRRIAAGSGTTVQDVNRLLKQFKDMTVMMKRVRKMGKKGLARHGLPGMMPPGFPGH